MSETRYLTPIEGARWAISRKVMGKKVDLVQNTSLDEPADIELIFRALGVPNTKESLDHYFPVRGAYGRCPTLDLMELFAHIDLVAVESKKETGV